MRTFWLAARIAGLFALLVILVLLASMLVARLTLGPRKHPLATFMGQEAFIIARDLEDRAGGEDLRRVAPALIRDDALGGYERELAIHEPDPELETPPPRDSQSGFLEKTRLIPCGDRTCKLIHGPPPRARIPLRQGGVTVATLEVTGPVFSRAEHNSFHLGLLGIGFLALLGIVGIALYLTRPLRQMTRSMDRIARGDLDHRVAARGRDEVARMARSFNFMADRLSQLIRSQSELAAGVSHELRSPLARMKLTLEMLREQGVDVAKIDDLEAEIDSLDSLVAEMLMASRLSAGLDVLELRGLDLRELVDEGWRRAEGQADEGAAPTLEIDIVPEAAKITADRPLAVRILGNLLENAVRYGEGGGEPISLLARREGDRVVITVSDEGPGVPPEALERIFDPFYRVDKSRSRRTGGSGLGLMLVRRAVLAHGGQVRARSREKGGLEVTFDMPAG